MGKAKVLTPKGRAFFVNLFVLGLVFFVVVVMFKYMMPSLTDNARNMTRHTSAETVELGAIEGNHCVTEVLGVDTTDGYAMQYKMVGNTFTIDCYNELIEDMNSQVYLDFVFSQSASKAYLDWNGKEYYFAKPIQDFVVTENNVGSLLTEVQGQKKLVDQ